MLQLWRYHTTLASLPSKQGLKQSFAEITDSNHIKSLASLPSKQGLKLGPRSSNGMRESALASLPSKQGLKRGLKVAIGEQLIPSRFTSIKTRIETSPWSKFFFKILRTLASLPSKQGLKLAFRARKASKAPNSRFTSIKTRIETGPGGPGTPMADPLASLPSKQGLKRGKQL